LNAFVLQQFNAFGERKSCHGQIGRQADLNHNLNVVEASSRDNRSYALARLQCSWFAVGVSQLLLLQTVHLFLQLRDVLEDSRHWWECSASSAEGPEEKECTFRQDVLLALEPCVTRRVQDWWFISLHPSSATNSCIKRATIYTKRTTKSLHKKDNEKPSGPLLGLIVMSH
jgi:hypothetical protein